MDRESEREDATAGATDVGVVVIARNEGERLHRCLDSLCGAAPCIVYVDSGSTDGSIDFARTTGADVVELDMSVSFTMARARNAGFDRLMELRPDTAFIQFVDGDCEVCAGWIDQARSLMESDPLTAVVGGRRRERYPDRSIYNRMCDIEWNSFVPGEVEYTGGDMMMRVEAFRQVGGFNAVMIAGEEPDLCFRLRARGWKILRADAPMTLHDAAITRFSQWWKRTMRAGHAYAECAWLHKDMSTAPGKRQVPSILAYGCGVPCVVAALAWFTSGLSAALLLVYPLLGWRVFRHMRRYGFPDSDARLYAVFCVLAKFPQLLGVFKFHADRTLRKKSTLIEYK